MLLLSLMFACHHPPDAHMEPAPEPAEKADPVGPKRNSWLAAAKLATTHFDMAQSDNFSTAIPQGEFQASLQDGLRIPAGPVNIITLRAAEDDRWWAINTSGAIYVDSRNSGWKAIASFDFPNVAPVSQDQMDAVLAMELAPSSDLATTYDADWVKPTGVNPTLRMLQANGVYACVDSDGYLYMTGAGFLYKLQFVDGEVRNVASINVKDAMVIPTEIAQFVDPKLIPGGITGTNLAYDGTLIVGTIFGLIAIDRDMKTVRDAIAFPIDQFFSTWPPTSKPSPEFVTNSFAVDETNGIYVASGNTMNRVQWTGERFSMDAADGAWAAKYTTGDAPPTIKYGTGTGSTPTLMGFGPNEDHLVVITDGANQMNLVAFWRDRQPEGGAQIAGQIGVHAGFDTPPAFVQSEQSVAVLDDGAFVVNNIAPTADGLRQYGPDPSLPDLCFNVLATGPMVEPGRGVERFKWDHKAHAWARVWANAELASTSMVPTISAASRAVCVNTYQRPDGWQVQCLDWDTGEIYQSVSFGSTSYGNGAYALLQYLPDGDLLFNGIGGTTRVPLKPSAPDTP